MRVSASRLLVRVSTSPETNSLARAKISRRLALPACGTMFDGKIGHDLAQPINDDDRVMIVGPVEARVMSNLFPWFHFCSSG